MLSSTKDTSKSRFVSGDFSIEEDYLTKFLICKVCHKIFKDPIRLHRCGHTFCK